MDAIRLFSDTMDFSHTVASGWKTLFFLFDYYFDACSNNWGHIRGAEITSLIVWILHLSASDFKESFSTQNFSVLMALSSTQRAAEINSLLLTFNDNFVHAKSKSGGYSVLQFICAFPGWSKDMSFGLNSILNKGTNLHSVGYDTCYSVKSETPTSLAMYSSFLFMKWRDALLRLSVNLEIFVRNEMQQSPLRDAGWDEESLLALFHCDVQSGYNPSTFDQCDECPIRAIFIRVELPWRKWLNRFKQKTNAEISSIDDKSGGAESDQSDGEILSDDESSGAESDRSDGEITEQNSSSLEAEETVLNESCEGEEVVDETVSSDLYESETENETFDAYFGDGTGFVCMRCYLKREGYESDIWSQVLGGPTI